MARSLPADPLISSLVVQARKAQLSRRSILAGVGVGASALALAACAPSGTTAPTPAADDSKRDKNVVWANRAGRLDVDDSGKHPTLERFSSETGITASYLEDVDNNNGYFAKVKGKLALGQDIGADVVCLSDWMTGRLVSLGYLQELDRSALPNLANLDPNLLLADYDSGRHFTLPWQGGFAGICWNKKAIPDGLRTVSDLWGPTLSGHVGVVNEMRDTIGVIMLDQGVDIESDWSEAYFTNALDVFRAKMDGQIRFSKARSYLEDLISGDSIAAICRSGDIAMLNANFGDQWEFAIPDGGGTLWYDNFVIPIGSRRKGNAEKLMNYYYEPEVAAEVAAWANFVCPVDGAQDAMANIDPALVDNQMIFPNAQTLASVKQFRTLSPAEAQTLEAAFQSVLLGA